MLPGARVHVRRDDGVAERDHAADGEVEAAREDDDGLPDRGEDERQRVVDERRPLEVAGKAVELGLEQPDVDAERPGEDQQREQSGRRLDARCCQRLRLR